MSKLLSTIMVFLLLMCAAPLALAAGLNELGARAQTGDAEAQYELGKIYMKKEYKDYVKANAWLLKAAEQGHVKAQTEIGYNYYAGLGTAKNLEEAEKWFNKAAAQNDAYAQFALGQLYKERKDDKKAFEFFLLSAEQYFGPTEQMVGLAYYGEKGVPKNLVLSYVFLQRSKHNPSTSQSYLENAKKILPLIKIQLSSRELAEAEAMLKEQGIPLD